MVLKNAQNLMKHKKNEEKKFAQKLFSAGQNRSTENVMIKIKIKKISAFSIHFRPFPSIPSHTKFGFEPLSSKGGGVP